MITSVKTGGNPKSLTLGKSVLMLRITIDTSPRCLKILTRNRPTPDSLIAKFSSSVFSNSLICSGFSIE